MSTTRLLPVLNAIGCVVLVGFILVQWRGGQALSRELYESRSREILEKNARFDAEKLSRQLQADQGHGHVRLGTAAHAALAVRGRA